jgi:pimeloyl-ACP methyl ester carboxylesterase
MNYIVKEEGKFRYIETGNASAETLLLLHGLMGNLTNFTSLIDYFSKNFNVVMPVLPIYDLPLHNVSLDGLVKHIEKFIEYKGYEKVHLVGNSLGGHLALIYTLQNPKKVASMTLTGSSGLYESSMGTTFPRRGDFEFIKKKIQETFYDPNTASKELIDDIFATVNDRNKALRIVMTSKSAVRHNLGDDLHKIKVPTLIIWGKQDNVTPPFVGEKFHELIKGSKLYWIDKCGHAPMMEHPERFNEILESFLNTILAEKIAS